MTQPHTPAKSLRLLAAHAQRYGLHTTGMPGQGPGPVLLVSNPLSPALHAVVSVTTDHHTDDHHTDHHTDPRTDPRTDRYIAFGGIVLGATADPRAAAARLAHLLGVIGHPPLAATTGP
jgi:hypothetical protein